MWGFQFVDTMARLFGFPRREARLRTEAVIEMVGMAGRCDRKIRGYSKGMRQRIKLAQALLHDPDLLILDEPLSGIDPIGRQELLLLFHELARRGKCLLISSHELEELEKLTDHVAIMASGRIAAVGTLTQIRDLLDNHPLSIRLASDQNHFLPAVLLDLAEVAAVDRVALSRGSRQESTPLLPAARRSRPRSHDRNPASGIARRIDPRCAGLSSRRETTLSRLATETQRKQSIWNFFSVPLCLCG